ncbi:flavodoxin domain-containing protein [Psittacicella gerlachiana]|uniref:Flavodoxin-like domain-containing protein n=1 Tax=Psittacicella gerlachiana TaxID=2028574 RepID=A0A3A1YAM8_9GAMM|nr:flavodoxin domain-containing protein [Psittacicella gerlachiana]RIY34725.1 hypothetical protein CKF59_04990 [Psittacicella gerlachiana]
MKFYVVSGSTLGTAEVAAETIVEEFAKLPQGEQVEAQLLHSPSLEQIQDASHLVIVCSTHGAGEYPDSFVPFVEALEASEQPLPNLEKLLLIGIGSSDYDTYNGAIKQLAQVFKQKNLQPLVEPLLIDVSEDFTPDLTAASLFTANIDEFFA